MSPSLSPVAAAATTPDASVASIGTPTLWAVTVGLVLALVVLDFLLTRRPHEVSLREALGWSAFYVALPLAFGGWVWARHGGDRGVEYLTGYLVEKSLSVDNLFIFMLLLAGFAVPKELQQRVLLYGVVGALALRGVFIALGAAALGAFDWVFLVFGIVLVSPASRSCATRCAATDRWSTSPGCGWSAWPVACCRSPRSTTARG